MNTLFIRVSCQKEREIWPRFRQHRYPQVIICGDPELGTNYKLDDDVLYVRCEDTWDRLPEKMIAAFDAVLSIPEFNGYDRFLKLDSDNGVRNSCKINEYPDIQEHDYVGQRVYDMKTRYNPRDSHFRRVSESSYWHNRKYRGPMYPYADGGTSYVLSRYALEVITSQYNFSNLSQVHKEHIYEDMMMGVLLKRHNIVPHQCYYYIAGDKKIPR